MALAKTEVWRLVVVLAKSLEDWLKKRQERRRDEALGKALPKPVNAGENGWNDAMLPSQPVRTSTSRCRGR